MNVIRKVFFTLFIYGVRTSWRALTHLKEIAGALRETGRARGLAPVSLRAPKISLNVTAMTMQVLNTFRTQLCSTQLKNTENVHENAKNMNLLLDLQSDYIIRCDKRTL